MSTYQEQRDAVSTVVPTGSKARNTFDLIDAAFESEGELERVLEQVLQLLTARAGARAGILWGASEQGFRWQSSIGIRLEEASRESEFTGDIVSNVELAFDDGKPDIFTCPTEATADLPGESDVADPIVRDLVLNHRQIVFSVATGDGPLAVFVIFQPLALPQNELWKVEDVASIQKHIENRLGRQTDVAKYPHHEVPSRSNDTPNRQERRDDTVFDSSDDTMGGQQSPKAHTPSVVRPPSAPRPAERAPVLMPTLDVQTEAQNVEDEPAEEKRFRDAIDEQELPESITPPEPAAASMPMLSSEDEDAFFSAKQQLAEQQRAIRVTEVVGRSLHEVECSFDVANEVHSYLGEGRVSVAIFRGNSCRVQAVSNQHVFDRRSGTIAAVEKLAGKCALIRRPIWHPEEAESLPQDIGELFERYYEAADSQSIALLPLIQKQEPSTDPNDLKAVVRDRDANPGEVVGVLVIEGLQSPLGEEDINDQWHRVEVPVVNAIANSRRHNSLFMMPVWKELGHFSDLFRGHHRNKAIGATAAAVAVIGALVAVPGDFKLRSEGVVQPQNRSKVFAETDGVVEQLLVKDGQWVEKGQTLITLSNPELHAELAKVEGELRETSEKLRTAKLQRMRGDFDDDEERKTNVLDSAGYAATLGKLQEQYDLLLEKKGQLTIKSPVSGQVVTWDTQRRLMARPVKSGQKLVTVADSKGPWELELKLPDRRSGYLRDVWRDDAATQGETIERPKASYVLASHPTVVNEGVVREVARSADVDEDDGNIIRVYVDLNEHPSDNGMRVRPGTEVIAHIHAGEASIGYCKLFEFFDWVRRTWFKYA